VTKSDKNKPKISTRQIKAIPFLVACPTLDAGCKKAKISGNTFYKWVRNPEFKTELKKQRDLVIEDALELLKSHITGAVDTLIKLLNNTESETLKRLICNDIINHTIKSKELEDLEKRISRLENVMKES